METLLPAILNCSAGKAFARAGFPIDTTVAKESQKNAVVDCGTVEERACNAYMSPCLFDLEEDPCEKRNVAEDEPEVVEFLQALIEEYRKSAVAPIRRYSDPDSAPSKWGYIWTFFKDMVSNRS